MTQEPIEVATGVLHTPDGESLDVHGGAYLTPEVYLATHAELNALREREIASTVPLVIGAALLGLGLGFWFGRRD
jgi:hypothetical protein